MTKLIGFALIVVATSAALMATPALTPEIDGGTAGSAVAMIAGVLLVMRGRRSK